MCSTAARASANGSESVIHHECINEAKRRMLEDLRKAANDLETATLPQTDRALIRADHEIELYGPETALPRAFGGICTGTDLVTSSPR